MNRVVKKYTGVRTVFGVVVNIHYPNRRAKSQLGHVEALTPAKSFEVANHSPCGFDWGYGGSGPAQLAIALLLDVGLSKSKVERLYHDFKQQIVSGLKFASWYLTDAEIMAWVKENSSNQLRLWAYSNESGD